MAAGVNPYLSIDPAAEGKSAPPWINLLVFLFLFYVLFIYFKIIFIWYILLPVRIDVPQKASDDTDPGSGLGHDLAASVETTYSEQSSSSAGSSSSSDQPIYFR